MNITPITSKIVWQHVPMRKQNSHKGTYGKLLCVAGSTRYRGAAALCVEGALRAGCGIVTLASVEPVFASIQPRMPECILFQCTADPSGNISSYMVNSLLNELANDYSALLIGPGLGNTPDTRKLVIGLIENAECQVILDADALNALSNNKSDNKTINNHSADKTETYDYINKNCNVYINDNHINPCDFNDNDTALQSKINTIIPLQKNDKPIIITPHPGEMARLCGCSIDDVKKNRELIALNFAKENNCIVVLKEHRTLIASPDGNLWRNTSGNSGLARGGSGDILAGMTGAFAAQGMDAEYASICAVWLHGYAAERCSQRKSETAMLPHDIFEDLGIIFSENNR